MPAPSQIPQPASRTPAGSSPPRGPLPWRSLVLVTALFLGFCAALQAPAEISCWHMAAANEYWTQGEMAALRQETALAAEYHDKAFAQLEQALAWSPGNSQWLYTRTRWNTQTGRLKEALADLDQLTSQYGNVSSLLAMRMEIHQRMKRHEDAVKEASEIQALSKTTGQPSWGDALNTSAYIKAVGKIDLAVAKKEADESVKDAQTELEEVQHEEAETGFVVRLFNAFFGVEQEISEKLAKDQLWQRMDTRGFIQYQMGNYEQALADLGPAADGYQELLEEKEMRLPKLRRVYPDSRDLELKMFKERRGAAVILYHRALAHEKLGHAAAAAKDLKLVREWIGGEPDETLF